MISELKIQNETITYAVKGEFCLRGTFYSNRAESGIYGLVDVQKSEYDNIKCISAITQKRDTSY